MNNNHTINKLPASDSYNKETNATNEGSSQDKKQIPQKGTSNGRSYVVLTFLAGAAVVAISATFFVVHEFFLCVQESIKNRLHKPSLDDHRNIDTLANKVSVTLLCTFDKFKEKKIEFKELFTGLFYCSHSESIILNYLEANFDITKKQWAEFLKGGQFSLDDDGESYDLWTKDNNISKKSRKSSHSSDDILDQYQVRGTFFKALLYFRRTTDGKKRTHFQLENNPFAFGYVIRHGIDYLRHKLTGKNVGPYGLSIHKDVNPILIKRKVIEAEKEKDNNNEN